MKAASRSVKMRRSERSRTKSLKAELEDSTQSKCEMIKLLRRKKSESEGASIRTPSEATDDGEYCMASVGEDEALQEKCKEERSEGSELGKEKTKRQDMKENPGRKQKKNEPETRDNSSGSQQDKTELHVKPEEEYGVGEEEEEGVRVLSGEGRWKHYPTLCATLPGRERQIQLLLTLLGEVSNCPSH